MITQTVLFDGTYSRHLDKGHSKEWKIKLSSAIQIGLRARCQGLREEYPERKIVQCGVYEEGLLKKKKKLNGTQKDKKKAEDI